MAVINRLGRKHTIPLVLLLGLAGSPIQTKASQQPELKELVYKAPPGGYSGLDGEVQLYGRSRAVVIGVSKYRNLPELPGAVRDARAVAELLAGHGFEVTLLLDGEATRSRIAEAIGDRLPRELGKNDRVLVYFAGHAVSVGSGDGVMGYLMPVEGDNERRVATGISMREVQAWLAAQPAKHAMFVADACYSGLALSTRSTGLPRTLSDYLAQALEKDVRLALAAGRSDQEAHEWNGHGLFTYFFLEGLKGQADANGDRIVTSSELYAYLEPNVSQTALANWSARQNPQMGRSGQGEFIFLVPAGTAPAVPRGDQSAANTVARDEVRLESRGGLAPIDSAQLTLPMAPSEKGSVVVSDAGSGLERSRFDWTADAGLDGSGRTVVKFTENGGGMVAPFPQPVRWHLESMWSQGNRFSPLWVERVYTDTQGKRLLSLRHDFDWSKGVALFTRTDERGQSFKKEIQVPPDTITGDGLALWMRTLPFESPRTVGAHFLTEEPNLYKVTFKIGKEEEIRTPAGLFKAYKVAMDVDLGLLNLVKVFVPKTFLWFSTGTPHYWVRSESLENGVGTPKVYRELVSK